MKRPIIKFSLVVLLVSALMADASGQARPSRRRGAGNPPAGNTQTTNNNNNSPSNFPANGNIPYRVDSSAGGGLDTTIRRSLRQDGAFAPDTLNQRTPLDYEFLRKDDALYAEKVWRELDLREKLNQSFRYEGKENDGDQQFMTILLKAILAGKVMAFDDDRFTKPLMVADIQQRLGG